MKVKTMLVMVVAGGVLGGSALAQGDGGRKVAREREAHGLADFVGLTPEQRERFEALRVEHRKETAPLRSEGRERHEKLRSALEATNPDPMAVGTAMIAVRQHGEKIKASADAFRSRLKAELTPEQQEKLDAFEAARRAGRVHHVRRGPRALLGDAEGVPLGDLNDGPPLLEEDVEGPPPR
jgi:Spy/CpxP family protein refolding chaperone